MKTRAELEQEVLELRQRLSSIELALAATTLPEKVEQLKVPRTTAPLLAFVVEMTEYERGWGQRPDGYLVFATQEIAAAHVHNETKNRTGPVPDEYVRYDLIGYKPVSAEILRKIELNGRTYVDRLGDLTA